MCSSSVNLNIFKTNRTNQGIRNKSMDSKRKETKLCCFYISNQHWNILMPFYENHTISDFVQLNQFSAAQKHTLFISRTHDPDQDLSGLETPCPGSIWSSWVLGLDLIWQQCHFSFWEVVVIGTRWCMPAKNLRLSVNRKLLSKRESKRKRWNRKKQQTEWRFRFYNTQQFSHVCAFSVG